MSDEQLEGWKRCIIRSSREGLEIAGAFAKTFGPTGKTLICSCGKSECWCGFSAHNSLIGSLRYRPLANPIAHVSISDHIRFGGGRKKEYIIGYRQDVLTLLWPRICHIKDCENTVTGLITQENDEMYPICEIHGTSTSLQNLSLNYGIQMKWLSTDYTRWAKIQDK